MIDSSLFIYEQPSLGVCCIMNIKNAKQAVTSIVNHVCLFNFECGHSYIHTCLISFMSLKMNCSLLSVNDLTDVNKGHLQLIVENVNIIFALIVMHFQFLLSYVNLFICISHNYMYSPLYVYHIVICSDHCM